MLMKPVRLIRFCELEQLAQLLVVCLSHVMLKQAKRSLSVLYLVIQIQAWLGALLLT